jgi:hypothetical protein
MRSSWNCIIWNAHAVEEQQRGVGRVHADLVDLLLGDPGQVHRHDDQALVLVHRAVAGIGEQAAPVGLQAVGDPHLAAVDDVVAAVLARGGLQRRDVGAAAGLAHRDAAHHVAGDRRHEELAAQLVGAEARERGRAHVGVHADGHRHAAAAAVAEGLGHHHRVAEVQAGAAELLGILQPQQSEVAELLEHFVRRVLLVGLPLRHERVQLLLDELLDGVGEGAVLGGELHLGCLVRFF